MKRGDKYFFCLLISISFSPFTVCAQVIPNFQPEEWSGSATFTYTVRGRNFFSELKHTARISKGIGTAQTTYRYTSHSSESSEKGSAQGEGASSIHIGFIDDPPGYSISLPVPAAIGTKTITYKSGAVTSELGQEESSIMISDQKLPKDPNILAGKIEESSNENGENSLLVITWNFYRGSSNVELIVIPRDYDSWLPIPGKDENTPGSKMTIYLELIGKDKKPPRFEAKEFELELKNTSMEQGIAINFPVSPVSNSLPDLRFLQIEGASISNHGQSMRLNAGKSNTDTFQIGAFDGGGRTTLVVHAVLVNGERIIGELEMPGGTDMINIPKRSNNSRIAQAWLKQRGKSAEDEDNDTSPGNENKGDGLTVFEEYRGVMSMSTFRRLEPGRKELFVQVEENNKYEGGLKLLAKAAGISVIPLTANEIAADRVVNKNSRETNKTNQHGLLLMEGTLSSGVLGENQPPEKKNKTPKDSERVIVDPTQLQLAFQEQSAAADSGGVRLLFTFQELVDATVAHELGHGIGLDHHGPKSFVPGRWINNTSGPEYHIYNFMRQEILDRPFEIKGRVGDVGCESSGDLTCIMVYAREYQWAYRPGPLGAGIYYYYAVPLLPEGNQLCTSSKGTGINASGYFGDATWGDCRSKLRIKD